MKPSKHNVKLLKFSKPSLICSKLWWRCKHQLIVNNIDSMMMAKLVYKLVVMPTPLMLVTTMLVKLVAMVMEVVVVAVLAPITVCIIDVMMLILHNQSTVMRMG
jgi:hypothetical protein